MEVQTRKEPRGPSPVSGELLERGEELSTIDSLLAAAREGRGGVLVIEGPRGIGKTSLVQAARSRAEAGGVETLVARGSELERHLPFGIARQLFEPLLVSTSDQDRDALLSGAARFAKPALGDELWEEPAHEEDASYATIHGLYWLAANVAVRSPLLIAVDDVHWSDPASLRWLSYLNKRIDGLPALALLSVTATELHEGATLLDEVISDPLAHVLRPGPLSEAAVAHLLRTALSSEPDDEFLSACRAVTLGRPFLLRELVDELDRGDVPPTRGNVLRVSTVGPKSISRSILNRIAHLPREAMLLATAVAILGEEADLRQAAGIAGLDRARAAEAAEALAAAEILEGEEGLGFVHPIVRSAIYSDLGLAQRARLHSRAAAVLQRAGAPPHRIAAHLLGVEPAGNPWAVQTLRAAAQEASARGAREEAVTYLRRALVEPPSDDIRRQVLIDLGWAEVHTGAPSGFDDLNAAMELARDPVERGRVAYQLGSALSTVGALEQAAAVLDRAASEVGAADRDLATRLEVEFITVGLGSSATNRLARERLGRLRERLGADLPDDPTLLSCLAVGAGFDGESRVAASNLARRALDAYRDAGVEDPRTIALIGIVLAWSDELDIAARLWEEALADGRRRGSQLLFATASCFRSNVAYRCGSLKEAEADARAALEIVDPGLLGFPGAVYPVAFLAEALCEQGDLLGGAEVLERAGIDGELPELAPFVSLLYSRAGLYVSQGRIREGTEDLLECGRRLEGLGIRNPAVLPWRSAAALGLMADDRREEARRLAAEEVALARRFGAPRALGIALRAAGLTAQGEETIERLREAVAVLEGSVAALELARAHVDLGAALRRAGKRSDARDPLRDGLHLALRCGATPLADRAHDELIAAGARPRRTNATGPGALTASESRVARMATRGLTNREIAQALFVTEKTIEMHLSNAYQKLGIRSRSQLADALSEGEPPALLEELTAPPPTRPLRAG